MKELLEPPARDAWEAFSIVIGMLNLRDIVKKLFFCLAVSSKIVIFAVLKFQNSVL